MNGELDGENIYGLDGEIKKTNEKNKILEKQLIEETENSRKQHTYLFNLQEKYLKLKADKVAWKKAIAEKKLPDEISINPKKTDDKKSEEEMINSTMVSLQSRLTKEKALAKKTIEKLNSDIEEYTMKIKAEEQEYKANNEKIRQLKKRMSHSKLKPIDPSELKSGLIKPQSNS